jgi:hypothetical protein
MAWLYTAIEAGVVSAVAVAGLHGGNFASWDVLAAFLVTVWKTAAAHLKDSPFAKLQPLADAIQNVKPQPFSVQAGPGIAQGGFALPGALLSTVLLGVLFCVLLSAGCQTTAPAAAGRSPATAIDVPKTLKVIELGAASVVTGVKAARAQCASSQCKVTDADVKRADDLALAVQAAVHSYAALYAAACPAAPASAVQAGTCVPPPLSVLEAALSCQASPTQATDCPMSRLVTLATDLGALK